MIGVRAQTIETRDATSTTGKARGSAMVSSAAPVALSSGKAELSSCLRMNRSSAGVTAPAEAPTGSGGLISKACRSSESGPEALSVPEMKVSAIGSPPPESIFASRRGDAADPLSFGPGAPGAVNTSGVGLLDFIRGSILPGGASKQM